MEDTTIVSIINVLLRNSKWLVRYLNILVLISTESIFLNEIITPIRKIIEGNKKARVENQIRCVF